MPTVNRYRALRMRGGIAREGSMDVIIDVVIIEEARP